MIRHLVCLALALLVIANASFSQGNRGDMDKLASQLDSVRQVMQTSLYLRPSKDIYISGEDLWFNAFVLNAIDFTLSALDNTLYLQLQKVGADSVLWEEMYPVLNGISYGHVYLPQTLSNGEYLLKGYTAHSYVSGQPYYYAVARIRVFNEPQEIRARKIRQLQNNVTSSEAVQFRVFPEGGHLLAGVPNRIAFKAVNKNGQPAEVKGTLLKGDVPVLNFKTVHAGMGSFLFTPEKGAIYRIRLNYSKDSLYPLPVALEEGLCMRLLKNEGDSLVFKIIAHDMPQKEKFYLRLQIRGAVEAIAAGEVGDSMEVKIPIQNSAPGVGEVTLFDAQQRPMAERLVYLHPDRQFHISFSQVKNEYAPKEQVALKIKTTDDSGMPVPAVFSLCVYDDLFHSAENTGNMLSYYYLSTQIRGKIYNPAYYFDSAHADRKAALDLLLLTQGWRSYTWSKEAMAERKPLPPVLSDTLQAWVTPDRKAGKEKQPVSLMLYNYNKTTSQFAAVDNAGKFYLTPANLAIGPRFFIQYFSEKTYNIHVEDPFEAIRKAITAHPTVYLLPDTFPLAGKPQVDTTYIPYGKTLKEITVTGKSTVYTDKYLGYLDSIAKYEGNTDYVGECGWLNCPDGRTNIKPVEGKTYHVFSSDVTSHRQGVILTRDNHKDVVYHYPKYTEEELLKVTKMAIVKGYYQSREFYEPDYDKESNPGIDTRNTLLWKPVIVTDKNGEATVQFFCSDIARQFMGIAEGVTGEGVLGVGEFKFRIRQ
ncbi:hypothetical protein FHW36_11348 [Chitinophaga polysaccharea]|uniref:MG2 domain-containing protein n=1 Tax=Chitinophaga polysaccharea TaxID=1293035 RepID=A0A561P3X2_9BACT|nr:hypothetical protein [Chitinophaga polysaccharea]TWF32794.1 hypothetical protein FHW36_11348 [Chitinophaga polysaccharea]